MNPPENDLGLYVRQVEEASKKRRLIGETMHDNWKVVAYFGPKPASPESVPELSFSACATTSNIDAGDLPNLDGDPSTIRVDYDKVSVVWAFAPSKSLLTRKLKKIFKGFNWRN